MSHPRRHVVGDERRNADAKIDQIARPKLQRDAPRDEGLGIHWLNHWR